MANLGIVIVVCVGDHWSCHHRLLSPNDERLSLLLLVYICPVKQRMILSEAIPYCSCIRIRYHVINHAHAFTCECVNNHIITSTVKISLFMYSLHMDRIASYPCSIYANIHNRARGRAWVRGYGWRSLGFSLPYCLCSCQFGGLLIQYWAT